MARTPQRSRMAAKWWLLIGVTRQSRNWWRTLSTENDFANFCKTWTPSFTSRWRRRDSWRDYAGKIGEFLFIVRFCEKTGFFASFRFICIDSFRLLAKTWTIMVVFPSEDQHWQFSFYGKFHNPTVTPCAKIAWTQIRSRRRSFPFRRRQTRCLPSSRGPDFAAIPAFSSPSTSSASCPDNPFGIWGRIVVSFDAIPAEWADIPSSPTSLFSGLVWTGLTGPVQARPDRKHCASLPDRSDQVSWRSASGVLYTSHHNLHASKIQTCILCSFDRKKLGK